MDGEAVRRQLGREPRPFRVAARCPFGLPSVIENERAQNMPTSFWVTCPSLVVDISRVESTGGVREAGGALYGPRVAGVREGGNVKCLHAFTALHLAGVIPNAVAEWTLERLERPYPEDACCTGAAEEPEG